MEKLNFTFTTEEINVVMNALGAQPYTQVFQLINNIQNQAQAQLTTAPVDVPEKTE
jgi:dihydroxyacetone kinase